MDFAKMTHEYYSKWLGVSPETMNCHGILFVKSPERDKRQMGYSQAFSIYAYITDKLTIISYSEKLSDKIEKLEPQINCGMSVKDISDLLQNTFKKPAARGIKFCYERIPDNIHVTNAVKLNRSDYPNFLEFFLNQHPGAKTEGWLEDYFNQICDNGFAFGVFKNNQLVSVADAPTMPYMQDMVQEVGINTLPQYRRKGYAKSASLACIKSIIEKGKCPMWSCSSDNTSSEQLAYTVGFKKLADIITM